MSRAPLTDMERERLDHLAKAHSEAYEAERDAKRREVDGHAYHVLLAARDAAWTTLRDALRRVFP